jgi:sugar lactone lactonase YvrE
VSPRLSLLVLVALFVAANVPGYCTVPASAVFVTPGRIAVRAGNGLFDYSGDGGIATAASFRSPEAIAFDQVGNLYIADTDNNCVRRMDLSGNISTVAGTTSPGYAGDGGLASQATLSAPVGIAVDRGGNLYIADSGNDAIREVDISSGLISTVAGHGTAAGNDGLGDGGPAKDASLWYPTGLAFDSEGNLYVADSLNCLVRKIDLQGQISAFAGNGAFGFAGDGGPATSAQLDSPVAIAVNASTLFIVDSGNDAIRSVNLGTGIIRTVAGGGNAAGTDGLGDGGPATNAELSTPSSIAVDDFGDIYIADTFDGLIRRVRVDGQIELVAGIPNSSSTSLESASAFSTSISTPYGLAINTDGQSLWIADTGNSVIRELRLGEGSVDISSGGETAIYLYNVGTQTVGLGPMSKHGPNSPDFLANNGYTSLLPGEECEFTASFVSTSTDPEQATLTIPNLDNGDTISINLAGMPSSGDLPIVALSATSLDLGSVPVGNTSAVQSITVSNTGNGMLTVQNVTASGDFSATTTCTSVAPGGQCSISVTLSPAAAGQRTGQIAIASNAATSPTVVSVTGTGTAPALALSATSLDLGRVPVGNTSAVQSITVSNTGNGMLTVQNVTASGDFSATTTCTSVASGGQCSISVTLSPAAAGQRTGQIAIASNAATSPTVVSVTGTGTAPALALSATSLDLGSVPVGNTTQSQALQVVNSGTATVTVESITATGGFAVTQECSVALTPGQSCTAFVAMTASATGVQSGLLTITTLQLPPLQVILSGSGRQAETSYYTTAPVRTLFVSPSKSEPANSMDEGQSVILPAGTPRTPLHIQEDTIPVPVTTSSVGIASTLTPIAASPADGNGENSSVTESTCQSCLSNSQDTPATLEELDSSKQPVAMASSCENCAAVGHPALSGTTHSEPAPGHQQPANLFITPQFNLESTADQAYVKILISVTVLESPLKAFKLLVDGKAVAIVNNKPHTSVCEALYPTQCEAVDLEARLSKKITGSHQLTLILNCSDGERRFQKTLARTRKSFYIF